jgi:hypothetical protein
MHAHTTRARIATGQILLLRLVTGLVAILSLVACGDSTSPSSRARPGAAVHSLAFPSFDGSSLNLEGSATIAAGSLALTTASDQVAAAWNPAKQRFSGGWETSFQFQVSPAGCSDLADGFAFVMQNGSATALVTGTGGSDLGYSGLRSAVAVEFDIFQSLGYPDPDGNHIAVVSMNAGATTISAHNTPLKLVSVPSIKDGLVHTVRMTYDKTNLNVYYDTATTPTLSVALNLLNVNGASVLDATGSSWVGFTAATGGSCAKMSILNWTLIDNQAPSVSPGGTVDENGVARYDAVEGSPLTLTASATDPDGDPIASYEWDWNGDGVTDTTSTTASVQHTFASCGSVPISVVAVDSVGARSAPAPAQVNVANVDPTVAALPALSATAGQPMTVSTTFSDPGADGPWSYHIDWGDGTAGVDGTTTDPSMTITGSHSYAPSSNTSYTVVVSVKDKCGGTGSAQTTVNMNETVANLSLGDLLQVYDGQPKQVTVTTQPANIAVKVTYNGSTTPPTNAGEYAIVATITDPQYSGSAAGQLVIGKAAATIAVEQLDYTYDGSPKSAHASTTPAGLDTVFVTYNGAPAPPSNAGNYAVIASLRNRNYEASAVNVTLVIHKAAQTVVFDALPNRTYGDAPFTLTAHASTALPITYSLGSASSGCSLYGSTVTITGATGGNGSCVIVSHQSGDANHDPAPDVTQSFSIATATPVITWAAPADMPLGSALGPSQLNASATGVGGAALPGSYVYSPPAGTAPGIGNYVLTTTFTPSDAADYRSVSASVSLRVVYLTSPGHQFLPPFDVETSARVKQKTAIAFQIFNADGVTPVATVQATLVIQPVSASGVVGDPLTLDTGNTFTYDPGTGRYSYALGSLGLTSGNYRITALLDDGSSITGQFTLARSGPAM